jgi:hypothetical protein
MLAIGPMVRGFKPGRGDGFLKATKIRNTPSFGEDVKPKAPWHKIIRHVIIHLQVWTEIVRKVKFLSLSPFLLLCCQMSLLVGMTESSGGRVLYHLGPLLAALKRCSYNPLTWSSSSCSVLDFWIVKPDGNLFTKAGSVHAIRRSPDVGRPLLTSEAASVNYLQCVA